MAIAIFCGAWVCAKTASAASAEITVILERVKQQQTLGNGGWQLAIRKIDQAHHFDRRRQRIRRRPEARLQCVMRLPAARVANQQAREQRSGRPR